MRRAAHIVVLLTLFARPVAAHVGSISYSDWIIRDRDVQVTVRLTQLDASSLPWSATDAAASERALGQYLVDHLTVSAGGERCPLTDGPYPLAAATGSLAFAWHLACPGSAPLRIDSSVLLAVIPTHLHFARVRFGDGPPLERVLSSAERGWTLAAPAASPSATATVWDYVRAGLKHVLVVPSHLVFVLALVLIATSIGEIATVVAGFALAQSIALALGALEYIRADAAPVDALIGLTIVLVAAENTWLRNAHTSALPRFLAATLAILAAVALRGVGAVPPVTLAGLALFTWCYFDLVARSPEPRRYRWGIAFVFGLTHGFSLAAALRESEPTSAQVARALFGFNLGVELGQLAVLICLLPLLLVAHSQRESRRALILDVGSAAVFGFGVFWFVTCAYR